MGALDNPRWEAFCQGMYLGETAEQAYVNAGYKRNRHNAARLKMRETIRNRITELQDRGQRVSDVTVASLTKMLMDEREAASAAGQHSAAVSAIEKVGKLHGLFVEKTENTNVNYDVSDEPLTEDEWSQQFSIQ